MRARLSGISIRGLRGPPDTGLSPPTTPEARLALVETLTREAWAITGSAMPTYVRRDTPISIRPLRPEVRLPRR
ncbi:MAG: hypothetical protein M3373_06125 [Gemmatimonadota bacterium]|nr:hypothetical protein [Gemmatimonadota bacterium]